jgi:hypothetical protein
MRYQPQGEFTPPNACNVIPPPDSAHQPLPGEMLAEGCPLGNIYGTATGLPVGDPPGASLCDTKVHSQPLALLALLDFQRVLSMRSQCNYVQTTSILTQAKLGEAFETMVPKQWLGAKVANLQAVGTARN